MGLYNYVTGFPEILHCTKCGCILGDFQTKSSRENPYMTTVHFGECVDFYSNCGRCALWHEWTHPDETQQRTDRPFAEFSLATEKGYWATEDSTIGFLHPQEGAPEKGAWARLLDVAKAWRLR